MGRVHADRHTLSSAATIAKRQGQAPDGEPPGASYQGFRSCWRLLGVGMGRPHTVSQHEDGSSSHCFWQREWVVPAACCAHIIPVTRLGRPQDNARGLPNLAVSAASWRQTQRPSAIWSIITNVTVSYLFGFHLLAIFSPTDVRPP